MVLLGVSLLPKPPPAQQSLQAGEERWNGGAARQLSKATSSLPPRADRFGTRAWTGECHSQCLLSFRDAVSRSVRSTLSTSFLSSNWVHGSTVLCRAVGRKISQVSQICHRS